jgi:hypothetical protein
LHGLAFPWLALGTDLQPGTLAAVLGVIVAVAGMVTALFALAKNWLELFPYVLPSKRLPSLGLTVCMAPEPPSHPLDRCGWISKGRGLRIFLLVYGAFFSAWGLLAILVGATTSTGGRPSLFGSLIRLDPPHVDWRAGWFVIGGFAILVAGMWLLLRFRLLTSPGEPWISQRLLTLDGDFDTVFSGCLRALPAAGARVVAIDRDGLSDSASGVLVAQVGGDSRGQTDWWSERMRVRVALGDASPRMVEVTSQSIRVRLYGRRNARNVARFCSRLME